jgi:hypothetical protein
MDTATNEILNTTTIYEEIHGLAPKIEIIKREHIVERFAHNEGINEKIEAKYFYQLWQPFAWAAILGFYYGKRRPLQGSVADGTLSQPFKYSVIYNNGNDVFYSLILFAIAREGYEILKDKSELNKAIEEFANFGFEVIYTILKEKGNDYFADEANFLQEIIDRPEIKESIKKVEKKAEEDNLIIDNGQGNFLDL